MIARHKRRFAVALLLAFIGQETWALAGTTGGLSGQVSGDKGAPIAGALVKVSSPSETTSTTTDSGGHFAFLSLAPDTYTLTVTKDNYAPATYPGVSIFADQSLTYQVQLTPALRQIAQVSSRARGSLVKPGTTVDVYAVNQTTATQLQTFGGGNNLDSAYSAVYAQPGVNGLPGNYGFGQVFYIHGSSYNQIGYEFDGIPVNRAFDNYNANSLSNLGTVSTEVYTGGGPAAGSAATLGGYINQVIKTGTFPGYATVSGGVGAPGFYHQLEVDAGGATPDRNFSYYVGLRGVQTIPNQIDPLNGGDLNPNGDNAYAAQGVPLNGTLFPLQFFGILSERGPFSECLNNGWKAPSGASTISPAVAAYYGVSGTIPTCVAYNPLLGTLTTALRGNQLTDRENVINLHFGIPHHNDSGKDDIQVLYDNFAYLTQSWDNLSTNGGLAFVNNALTEGGIQGANYFSALNKTFAGFPLPYPAQPQWAGLCAYYNFFATFGYSNPCPTTGNSPSPWGDSYIVHGATFGQSATGSPQIVQPYFFPSSPTDRAFGAGLPTSIASGIWNDGAIEKLQYQKNFGANAYLRLFGYGFYSDWLQNDPNTATFNVSPYNIGGSGAQGDYELATHTVGGGLQYANQINAQNLVTLTADYVTANYMRYNNLQSTFSPNGTPVASLLAGGTCFSAISNNPTNSKTGPFVDNSYPLTLPIGSPVSCISPLASGLIDQVVNGSLPAVSGKAAAAGAAWQLTQNLEPDANRSTVGPRFLTAALQDEIRPSDRWDVNLGVRLESYGYALGNYGSPEQSFWFNQINATACVDPAGLQQAPSSDLTGQRAYSGVSPAFPTYITTAPGAACPFDPVLNAQLYHPGQHGVPEITLGGAGTITNTTTSPRVGFTYTIDPDAVLRFSYGRYTQPTQTASEQVLTYLDGYQMANNLYNSAYYNNGYSSIVHNNPIQFSNNFDASYEEHLKGTDWSFKVSPYSRYTTNQSVEVALPGGLAGSFNSGTQKTTGVELAVQKGDPSRNGFSGQFSYTYTYSVLKYSLINGSNIVSNMLSSLKNFTSLEKINGGSPCYVGTLGIPDCSKAYTFQGTTYKPSQYIANPYYNMDISYAALQSAYPLTGWYPTFANTFPYGLQLGNPTTALAPNIFSGFVSFKHDKVQAALTGQLWQGTSYGSPVAIAGLDPRFCGANQGATGYTAGSQLADYQTCSSSIAIPNPLTGQFDGIGQYRQPWQLNLGAQVAYDLTPRIAATVALANIFNTCFGGSAEPWTAGYAPNRVICGYSPSSTYLAWSPGEVYNTAGAGYFYGSNPHAKQNGTAGYPNLFNQAYVPTGVQISAPFQAYFQVHVKI